MAKIRFVSSKNKGKRNFKRKMKIKKWSSRIAILGLLVFIAYDKNLHNLIFNLFK